MCHPGRICCPIWRPFFICGTYSLCSGRCLCLYVCTQFFTRKGNFPSPKGNSFFYTWSLRSNVCCYFKAVAFVRNNTGHNLELLVLYMDYERKTEDFINSQASRDHYNQPTLRCRGTALFMEEKIFTAKKRDVTSISSHKMMANTMRFPSTDRLI